MKGNIIHNLSSSIKYCIPHVSTILGINLIHLVTGVGSVVGVFLQIGLGVIGLIGAYRKLKNESRNNGK